MALCSSIRWHLLSWPPLFCPWEAIYPTALGEDREGTCLRAGEGGLRELQSLVRSFTCAVFPLLTRRKLCLGDQVTLRGPRAEGWVALAGREGHTVRKGWSWTLNPGISVPEPGFCATLPLWELRVCAYVCAHVHAAGAANKLARTQEGSPKVGGTRRGGGQAPTRQTPTRGNPPHRPLHANDVQVVGWEAARPTVLVCCVLMELPSPHLPSLLGPP